ncbi:MAG: hypothetical protein JXR19_03885 [Bacteroidia bacterium]
MNRIIGIVLVLLSMNSYGQFGISGVGIGLTGNATSNMKSKGVAALFTQGVWANSQLDQNIYNSRIHTAYTAVFSSPDKDFFALELDLMQGSDNIFNSDYSWRNNGDSSFSESVSFDISGANLGLRAMFKLRTDPNRRFHYNFGIGLEGIYTYGISVDGEYQYDANHWPSSYFFSEYKSFKDDVIDNYMTYNVIQQVGAAFRLGKDEMSYPLDRTYIELNFHILSNFSTIVEDWSTYRSYGGSMRLIYELK